MEKKVSKVEWKQDDLLTRSEVATALRVTVKTIDRWKTKRMLPYMKLSRGFVRFRFGDVKKKLDEARVAVAALLMFAALFLFSSGAVAQVEGAFEPATYNLYSLILPTNACLINGSVTTFGVTNVTVASNTVVTFSDNYGLSQPITLTNFSTNTLFFINTATMAWPLIDVRNEGRTGVQFDFNYHQPSTSNMVIYFAFSVDGNPTNMLNQPTNYCYVWTIPGNGTAHVSASTNFSNLGCGWLMPILFQFTGMDAGNYSTNWAMAVSPKSAY